MDGVTSDGGWPCLTPGSLLSIFQSFLSYDLNVLYTRPTPLLFPLRFLPVEGFFFILSFFPVRVLHLYRLYSSLMLICDCVCTSYNDLDLINTLVPEESAVSPQLPLTQRVK